MFERLEINSKVDVLNELKKNIKDIENIDRTKVDEIENEVKELYKKQVELYNSIDKIDNPRHRILLRYRLVMGYTWETISEKMECDLSTVYRIRKEILKKETRFKI